MMVNAKVYLDQPEKMAQVDSQRKGMLIANIVMILLIAANTVMFFLAGGNYQGTLFIFADYSFQVLLWGMLIAWAWSLFRVYKDIKHSEKLLPYK